MAYKGFKKKKKKKKNPKKKRKGGECPKQGPCNLTSETLGGGNGGMAKPDVIVWVRREIEPVLLLLQVKGGG